MRILLLIACALAQASAALIDEPTPVLQVPRLAVAPALTAAADDAAWAAAAVIPALGLSRREEGDARKAAPTEVRVGWDAKNLYVRFICTDSELFTPVRGRDAELYRGDAAEVFFDAVGDGLATYELQVSPKGDLFDQTILLTAPMRNQPDGLLEFDLRVRDLWMDASWNLEGLRTAAQAKADGTGWIVDFAIPAASALRRLGRTEYAPMDLRVNLLRYEYPVAAEGSKRELLSMNWSTVTLGCPHVSPARKGTLRLVD